MVCIIFGLRVGSRLNANTAVKWIIHMIHRVHFIAAAAAPEEAPGFPLPAVKWCLALSRDLPREVVVHWPDLQAQYLSVSSALHHHELQGPK